MTDTNTNTTKRAPSVGAEAFVRTWIAAAKIGNTRYDVASTLSMNIATVKARAYSLRTNKVALPKLIDEGKRVNYKELAKLVPAEKKEV